MSMLELTRVPHNPAPYLQIDPIMGLYNTTLFVIDNCDFLSTIRYICLDETASLVNAQLKKRTLLQGRKINGNN